jgi:glutamate mutase epsilon subunit
MKHNPNSEVEFFNQVLAYTECLYDYRDSTQFILNVDVDEVLVPRNSDSLVQELIRLANKFPNAGSFEFLEATTLSRNCEFLS